MSWFSDDERRFGRWVANNFWGELFPLILFGPVILAAIFAVFGAGLWVLGKAVHLVVHSWQAVMP